VDCLGGLPISDPVVNSESSSPQIRDLGEQGVLKRLQCFCPAELVGDDAAVVATAPGQSLVATTDVLVDGVHFSDRTTSPEDVGWRAAAVNLSDLAAMGATPVGLTVGLAVSGDVPMAWIEQLYQGLTACLQQYNTVIVGGDVCRSPVITVAITAFGQVLPGQVIRRSAAQPGDVILVTGVHGASRAGLELLLHPSWGMHLHEPERKSLIQAHQRPKPRLDVPPLLRQLDSSVRVAGMDSSDGLADAVLQICRASGVGARIERNRIPIPDALTTAAPEQALEWALYGGEDFELVLTLPPAIATTLAAQLGNSTAIIGEVVAGATVQLVDDTGQQPAIALSLNQGFQHF